MILYNIQHFGDWTWLPWLVRMLQHPENQFLVTYDGPEEEVTRIRNALNALGIEAKRIVVEQSLPIHWCGPSQAKMLMQVLGRSLEFSDWTHFVNLSGTCVPLQSQDTVHSTIKHTYKSGIAASFYSFPVRKLPEMPTAVADGLPVEMDYLRLKLRGPRALLEQFKTAEYFPVRNVHNRVFVHCAEPEPEVRVLEVSRPDPEELEFRRSFFASFPHYCGPAWYMFHRSACDALVEFFNSEVSYEFRRIFLNCFEPDESFLATAIRGCGALDSEAVGNNSLRSFQGSMRQLTDNTFDLLMEQRNSLFARKVVHESSAKIIDYVEEAVAIDRR